MIAQLKADLASARKRLKAIEAHRARLNGRTPDRWLEQRHSAATQEVNELTAQIAALKVRAAKYSFGTFEARAGHE